METSERGYLTMLKVWPNGVEVEHEEGPTELKEDHDEHVLVFRLVTDTKTHNICVRRADFSMLLAGPNVEDQSIEATVDSQENA